MQGLRTGSVTAGYPAVTWLVFVFVSPGFMSRAKSGLIMASFDGTLNVEAPRNAIRNDALFCGQVPRVYQSP